MSSQLKSKKILITGASVMIGSLLLELALMSDNVRQVTSLARKPGFSYKLLCSVYPQSTDG